MTGRSDTGARPGTRATRILCIDDDPNVLGIMERALRMKGHDVVPVRDGPEGLRRALTGEFDLVISDVMMPGLDGYDLCQAIRSSPSTARTPVIIASARIATLTAKTALIAGADAFLQKPFRLDELQELVARLVK
jgi:two-component system response regulator MprA